MRFPLILLCLSLPLLAACSSRSRCCPQRPVCCPRVAVKPTARRTPGTAERPAPRLSRLYRASNGEAVTIEAAAAEWKDSDLIAFGELHGDLQGARAQLAVLKALAGQERPVALAMEFFERDTQADLDAYLAGELDEESFRKKTKRNAAYAATHGPLVAFCKANGIPVIAANAPRRLVTGYRKSEGDYEAYLESLSEEERALLPEDTDVLEDEYQEKFLKLMGMKRGPSFFKSQSLWDDAMAESMVDFRAEHPEHRIFFVVGVFHVESGLGTITKYRNRRGKDDVRILRMLRSTDPALAPSDDEMGTADVILKVRVPKPSKAGAAKAAKPLPKGHPKKASSTGPSS